MKKLSVLFLSLVSLVASQAAFAGKADDLQKCVDRVKEAGCTFSNNDSDRVEDNVYKCRQAKDKDGIFEVFLLNDAGKVVVVDTDGYNRCAKAKYTLDPKGITEFKVIGNSKEGVRVYFLSNSGRVYTMDTDQVVYEILSGSGNSYDTVVDIKGVRDDATAIKLVMKGNMQDVTFTRKRIEQKLRTAGSWSTNEARKVEFRWTTTNRSLFRDE